MMTNNKTTFSGFIFSCALFASSWGVNADAYNDAIKASESGNYQRALNLINTLIEQDNNNPRALLLLANTHKAMGDLKQAKLDYQDLIKKYPDLPEPYNNLAIIHAEAGDTTKAIDLLIKVFETNQSYSLAYQNLRTIYNDIASETYREALDINDAPKNKSILFSLNDIYHQQTIAQNSFVDPSLASNTTAIQTATAVSQTSQIETVANNNENIDQSYLIKETEVSEMVLGWADAWASQDVARYLSYYHQQFVTPNRISRSAWEEQRQNRIESPEYIQVKISDIVVEFSDANTAVVNFRQKYRASNYGDDTFKKLTLATNNGQWKIVTEQTL
jgi:tetratricopeptide (TPR) repeat protein